MSQPTTSGQPEGFPFAIQIECSAVVTHPDGTTDEDESEVPA